MALGFVILSFFAAVSAAGWALFQGASFWMATAWFYGAGFAVFAALTGLHLMRGRLGRRRLQAQPIEPQQPVPALR